MDEYTTLIGIAGAVISWVAVAAILRALVKNFRPDTPHNTWKTALAVSAGMSLIGFVLGLAAGDFGQLVRVAGFVANVALIAGVYRMGVGLSIGIGILMGIIMLAIMLGAALFLGFLAAFGPVGIVGGLIVGVGAPIAMMIRNRRQEQAMIEAYGSDSIKK